MLNTARYPVLKCSYRWYAERYPELKGSSSCYAERYPVLKCIAGGTLKGILVEVEYLPGIVPGTCWALIAEFMQVKEEL